MYISGGRNCSRAGTVAAGATHGDESARLSSQMLSLAALILCGARSIRA
jgi:hypothetical protein